MGAPDSPSFRALADDVKKALAGLEVNLRKSPYMDKAVKPLHPSVANLCDMIQAELSDHPDYVNKSAVRGALNSLRSVEGSIQLLITASNEYRAAGNLAEKHQIQDTWIVRKNRLVNEADLCAEILGVVLAFADHLDLQAGRGMKAGSNPPGNTTNRKRKGQAS